MGRLRVGRGLDGAVDMGTRGAAARDLAQHYVLKAQSQGAQVSRGHRVERPRLGRGGSGGLDSWALREQATGSGFLGLFLFVPRCSRLVMCPRSAHSFHQPWSVTCPQPPRVPRQR